VVLRSAGAIPSLPIVGTKPNHCEGSTVAKTNQKFDAMFGKVVAFAFNRPGKGTNAGGTVKSVSMAPRIVKDGKASREGRFNFLRTVETLYKREGITFDTADVVARLEALGHEVVKSGNGHTVYAIGVSSKSGGSSTYNPDAELDAILSMK
jgi:hypothetical protein